MKRAVICARGLLVTLAATGFLIAAPAGAEELSPPPLETAGKPVSPPAPTEGLQPRLAGLNALVGAMVIDLGPLNDRLSRAGYPNKLPLAFPILGGQGFGLFSRFLIGGSGTAFLSRTVDAPGGEVSASGAWGTVDLGYQLIRINGFLVAPILSLGGYGMTATVRTKADTSFDGALEEPTRSTSLTNKGALAGVSVMANLIVLGRKSSVRTARSGWTL